MKAQTGRVRSRRDPDRPGSRASRPRVAAAVARMQQAGIAGCIVTGRMYRATVPFARKLGFDAPLVCYQGAAVIDPSSDEDPATLLDAERRGARIVDARGAEDMHLQLYRNDEYYCEDAQPLLGSLRIARAGRSRSSYRRCARRLP